MQSVGSFLKEKLGNMAKWVTEEVGKENLSIDIEKFVCSRSELEVTFLAETLNGNATTIVHKDWCGLSKILTDDKIPLHFQTQFSELLHAVRGREDLHDKFWRYMNLFKDVVNSDVQLDKHVVK
jgi:hypothetical protein